MKRIIWVMGICLILLVGSGMATKAKAAPGDVQSYVDIRGSIVCGFLDGFGRDGLTAEELGKTGLFAWKDSGLTRMEAAQIVLLSVQERCPEWTAAVKDLTLGPVIGA